MIPASVAKLAGLLSFFAQLAALTQTKVDDALVALAQAIVDDPALGKWFDGVAQSNTDGVMGLLDEASQPAEVREALGKRGFDFAKVIELLPLLIQFWGMFK